MGKVKTGGGEEIQRKTKGSRGSSVSPGVGKRNGGWSSGGDQKNGPNKGGCWIIGAGVGRVRGVVASPTTHDDEQQHQAEQWHR
jgi:hypothetical protein